MLISIFHEMLFSYAIEVLYPYAIKVLYLHVSAIELRVIFISVYYIAKHLFYADVSSSPPAVDVCCVCCPQSIKVYLPREPGPAQ